MLFIHCRREWGMTRIETIIFLVKMNFIDEIRGKGNFEAKKSPIIMRDYNFNCSYPKKSIL